jgi:hypothetical protein
MKSSLRMVAAAGVIGLMLTICASATITPPSPVWDQEIRPQEILGELFAGNYRYALQLAKDFAVQEARKKINDGTAAKVLVSRLAAALNKIIDDPGKTQVQKEDEIFALINASLEPQSSAPVGPLNLTLRHSVEYGVTRLEWDAKTVEDTCYFGTISGTCHIDSGLNPQSCSTAGNGGWARYYRQPEYIVLRTVSGQSTGLTRMPGYAEARSTGQPFDDLWTSVRGFLRDYYQQHYGEPFPNAVPPGRVFFYDVHGEFRDPGTTLSYEVLSDDVVGGLYQGCGGRHGYRSVAVADSNGDGRMDYLPASAYSKYFAKYYGWLPGVVNSLLD